MGSRMALNLAKHLSSTGQVGGMAAALTLAAFGCLQPFLGRC